MYCGLREASTKQQHHANVANSMAVRAERLRVRFVSGCDSRAAQLAAHYTQALARGRLQVEVGHAADFAARSKDAQPSVIVVIHVGGEPAPLIADEFGGRVDWHLDGEALSGDASVLAIQLQLQAARLLGDLGYLTAREGAGAPRRTTPRPPLATADDRCGPDLLAA
jgi:hypothetical protein